MPSNKSVFMILLIVLSTQLKAQEFIWADDQDYTPYIFINDEGKPAGIFFDVMTTAFARMEQPLSVKLYPWKRAQSLVHNGHADGMITIPTKDRLVNLVASEPLFYSEVRIHFLNSHSDQQVYKNITHLEELKSALLVDYIGDGWAEANLTEHQVIWAPNYTSAVWMLAVGRADIFLDDPVAIKHHIKQQVLLGDYDQKGLMSIISGDIPLVKTPITLLIKKGSSFEKLLPKFNKEIEKMKKDGSFETIFLKYK